MGRPRSLLADSVNDRLATHAERGYGDTEGGPSQPVSIER